MKKHLPNLLLALVLLAGLALLLYPSVSNYINTRHQSHAVSTYEAQISTLSEEDYAPLLEAAEAYNEALVDNEDRFLQTDEDAAQYNALLNPTGNGIIGYVEIDEIAVKLPIYHGTDDSVLQVGAGHIEGTSLPIGGAGTHCGISGHRGLPSAMLFTDLDKLKLGDVFTIHTLDLVLTYQVDQILVVEPSNVDALAIEPGKDYCTLVTCTPYGINSHRLMVRGVRIETVVLPAEPTAAAETPEQLPDPMALALVLGILFLLALALVVYLHSKRKARREERKQADSYYMRRLQMDNPNWSAPKEARVDQPGKKKTKDQRANKTKAFK